MNDDHHSPNPSPGTAGDRARCALFGGGGSGGHVFPGLAIAEELNQRGWEVGWMGTADGMEARLLGDREVPFFAVDARPVVGRGALAKALAAATLLRSAWSARRIVRQLDARVVIGTGGYASVPAVLGGRLAARPILLFEPNAEPGAANRWLSRIATEAAIAFPGTERQLHCRAELTGIPVRQDFFAALEEDPESAEGPARLLVLGGSQGARQLNELLPMALSQLEKEGSAAGVRDGTRIEVCHQVGARHVDETRRAYEAAGLHHTRYEIVPFLDDVATEMKRSQVVLSRAGAITLAELCAAGRASILIPLTLAGGHQLGNARRLEEAGAARVLDASDARPERLAAWLGELLRDDERRQRMAAAARRLGRAHAASDIADRVEALGGSS